MNSRPTPKSFIAVSGGIDSTALALELLSTGENLHGIFLNMGQLSARKQLQNVRRFSLQHDMPLHVANIPGMADFFSPFLEAPFRMLSEPNEGGEGPPSASLAMIAASYAVSAGSNILFHAATKEDGESNLERVLNQVQQTIVVNTGNKEFKIRLNYIGIDRIEVLKKLNTYDASAITWSCDWGNELHCGTCRGCEVRKNRFASAGLSDSTEYLS